MTRLLGIIFFTLPLITLTVLYITGGILAILIFVCYTTAVGLCICSLALGLKLMNFKGD